jgi:hypothetical protein
MLKHQACHIEHDHVRNKALELVAVIPFNLVIEE